MAKAAADDFDKNYVASHAETLCFSSPCQVLDLSANAIEGLPPLATALPALADLILDDNSLRALGDELVGLSKLKKLSAKSNRIAAVDPFSGQQVRISVRFCWFLVIGS